MAVNWGMADILLEKEWIRSKVLELDWESRHIFVLDFLNRQNFRNSTAACRYVCRSFGPDELIVGTNTGRRVPPGTVICLHDKPKAYRQLRLTRFFRRVKLPKGKR